MTAKRHHLANHAHQLMPNGNVIPKPYRPKSIGDARKIIAGIFERNRWDRDLQKRYFTIKGLDAENLEDLSSDEIRQVIGHLEKARMLIFAD